MIDDKKLIEEMNKTFPDKFLNDKNWFYGKCSFMDLFSELIENQPKVGEWIPCSERLPNRYNNILICQNDGYVNVGYYSLNGFKDMNSYPYKDVIAWQELPEPYKVGDT